MWTSADASGCCRGPAACSSDANCVCSRALIHPQQRLIYSLFIAYLQLIYSLFIAYLQLIYSLFISYLQFIYSLFTVYL